MKCGFVRIILKAYQELNGKTLMKVTYLVNNPMAIVIQNNSLISIITCLINFCVQEIVFKLNSQQFIVFIENKLFLLLFFR